MAIKVYADAGSNLFKAMLLVKKCEVTVVNLTLDVNGKNYNYGNTEADVQKNSTEFYNELKNGANVKTSLVNPGLWMDAFEQDIKEGNQIICFTIASGISGTYQAACIAASMINDEQGKEVVKVIDSKTAGFGEGIQAINACKLIKQGKSFEEVCKECEDYVLKVRSEFTVGDIQYLSKTGRVSALVAKIASLLNIKPILKGSKDATIVMSKKVRGKMLALKSLCDSCVAHIKNPEEQTVYITHCDDEHDANLLKSMLEEKGIKNIETYYHELVTGSHLGPSSIALFYVGSDRED